jgi:hypothetical protein
VSVELDGTKTIFTYDSNYHNRPAEDVAQHGAKLEEFYELTDIRKGRYSEADVGYEQKLELRQLAEEFLSDEPTNYDSTVDASRPPQETMQQLRDLGYQ